jgi:hypothetical protein
MPIKIVFFLSLGSSPPPLERTQRVVQAFTQAHQTTGAIATLVRRLARQAIAESRRAIPSQSFHISEEP